MSQRLGTGWATLAGTLVLAVVVAAWAWGAFSDHSSYDTGLAYFGGQVAWATGHPEAWFSWFSTPFLGAVVAILTRLMSSHATGVLITAVNLVLVVATTAILLRRLHGVLQPAWWWLTALMLLSFAPMMSSVWWKQFNIIVLVLAVAGFEQLRRGRAATSATLIGISVAFKPLAIVLPFALLARRQTRLTGVWALVWAAALNIGSQWLMAAHAHDARALNPLLAVENFSRRSTPSLICNAQNFSPQGAVCRLLNGHHVGVQRLVVWLLLLLTAVWFLRMLRAQEATSWEVFAFSCAFSTMASPIAWSHYQVMLAPLFVLLLVRFSTGEAPASAWMGLALALVLSELMWTPYGTIVEALRLKLSSINVFGPRPLVAEFAQCSQYVLLVTGALWYAHWRHNRSATPRQPV